MASRVKFEASAMQGCSKRISSISKEVSAAAALINGAKNNENWACPEKRQIGANLDYVRSLTNKLTGSMGAFSTRCSQAAQRFSDVEQKFSKLEKSQKAKQRSLSSLLAKALKFVKSAVEKLFKSTAALLSGLLGAILITPLIKKNIFKASGAGAATGDGVRESLEDIIREIDETNGSNGTPSTDESSSISGENGTSYTHSDGKGYTPDWATVKPKGTSITCKDGTPWSVYMYNNEQGEISCTYYTLNRLREKGREFPFGTKGAAGKQWFDNATDVPKIAGKNPLSSVVEQFGDPVENIVISTGPSSGAGHVMLIDKIENGMVYFTEHKTVNYTSPCSISRFEAWYNNGNYYGEGILGAVIIG